MKDTSLFTDERIQQLQKTRKIFLKFAVWILIAELVFGVFIILTGSWNLATIGRIQATFLLIALILFVNVCNFTRMETGNKIIQIFALIGFLSSLIWGVFAFLLMWEIVPTVWIEEVLRTSSYSKYSYTTSIIHMTIYTKIMLIISYVASGSFCISNVLAIKESIKVVKPLKITAVACVAYLWAFGTITTLIEPDFTDITKFYQLAALAGLAFVITTIAALIISNMNNKKPARLNAPMNMEPAPYLPKTEAELRAEIEEKIRREMIEKEIRAKMEAEQINPNIVNPGNTEPNDFNDQVNSGPESTPYLGN